MQAAKNNLMTIIHDINFISDFFKNISRDYELVYMHNLSCYALFDTRQDRIIITFNQYPNADMIKKYYETKYENQMSILKKIEEENNATYNAKLRQIKGDANDRLNEAIKFAAKKGSGDICRQQIKHIIK